MKISFHKTLRFLCWASMPTDSPCLLSINTDRECAAHLSCNTQLAWCSHCMITTTDLLLSLSHTRTTSPLISARPNCFNMHRWKAKLCWARPQSLRLRWCHFNVLAGSFDAIRGSQTAKTQTVPPVGIYRNTTGINTEPGSPTIPASPGLNETLERQKLFPDVRHRKCMGGIRGWEARNMR